MARPPSPRLRGDRRTRPDDVHVLPRANAAAQPRSRRRFLYGEHDRFKLNDLAYSCSVSNILSQVVYSVGLVVACLMTFYVTLIYAELGTSMNISLGTGYSFTLASTFVFAKLIEDLKVSAPSFLFALRAHFVSSLLRRC